jgi:glycosyltransferase involved in cell wall biosynthesis
MTGRHETWQSSPIADIALIVTVLNEEASLSMFLCGLEKQSCLPAEIIITDGGSVDRTVELLECWDIPSGVKMSVITVKGANISRGRNIAIERASHERVAVTDAGTALDPDWLLELQHGFEGGADVVSGFFVPTGKTFFERTLARVVTPLLDEINPEEFLPSSRSVGFTKSAWSSAGGYPEWLDYCEDLVFDLALRATGARFTFAPKAIVTWSARSDLRGFGKQYFRYARGDGKAGLFARRHAARYLAYALGILLLSQGISEPWLLTPLAFGLLGYQFKFFRRILKDREQFGSRLFVALLLTPALVTFGDLAKMIGYPAGCIWKRRTRALQQSVRKTERAI